MFKNMRVFNIFSLSRLLKQSVNIAIFDQRFGFCLCVIQQKVSECLALYFIKTLSVMFSFHWSLICFKIGGAY